MPVLFETHHLIVRVIESADRPSVHEYASDPLVVRYLEWGPNTVEETQQFIDLAIEQQQQHPRLQYDLAICRKDFNQLIGACRLQITDPLSGKAEIGYCLNQKYWNRGFATEAIQGLVDYAFQHWGVSMVLASTDPDNHASIRILQKVGMKKILELNKNKRRQGVWRDSYVFELTKPE